MLNRFFTADTGEVLICDRPAEASGRAEMRCQTAPNSAIRRQEETIVKSNVLSTVFVAAALCSTSFHSGAWTDKPRESASSPSTCRLEPEAQCTQAVFIGLQAPGLDMHHASMPQIRLDGANLARANLSYATLQLANLKGANLMLGNLEGAHLHAANLRKSNLMMANMRKVNLLDADLRGANLQGANLQGAILIKAKLGNATWTDGRVCAPESVGACL